MRKAAAEGQSSKAAAVAARIIPNLEAAARKVNDDGAGGALARGIIFQNASFIDDAIGSFREALALDPNLHEAAARLVLTLLRARRAEAALDAAMKLARAAPDYAMPEISTSESVGVFTILGNALIANGRLSDAQQAYETALKKQPKDTTAAARLAQVHIASGTPERALGHAKAVKANPRYSALASLLNLGRDNAGLLSAFSPANVVNELALDAHGRPYVVGGEARLAPVADDSVWSDEQINIRVDR